MQLPSAWLCGSASSWYVGHSMTPFTAVPSDLCDEQIQPPPTCVALDILTLFNGGRLRRLALATLVNRRATRRSTECTLLRSKPAAVAVEHAEIVLVWF